MAAYFFYYWHCLDDWYLSTVRLRTFLSRKLTLWNSLAAAVLKRPEEARLFLY